jgi:carboxymethylenebutenolidase
VKDADIDEDTAGLIGFLEAQPEVRTGQIGSVGYCMSGRFVTTAARSFPDRFACAASLYGTRLVTDEPDSPHLDLSGIKAEMYYGFGTLDQTTPPDYIKTFTECLNSAGVNYTMDIFDDVDHGYAFVERAMYDPAAAEASWTKVFDLFARNLT